jgi:hypothetical protein
VISGVVRAVLIRRLWVCNLKGDFLLDSWCIQLGHRLDLHVSVLKLPFVVGFEEDGSMRRCRPRRSMRIVLVTMFLSCAPSWALALVTAHPRMKPCARSLPAWFYAVNPLRSSGFFFRQGE